MKSKLITLLLLLPALAANAQVATNTIETWSAVGVAGWTTNNGTDKAALSNPSNHLNMAFAQQSGSPESENQTASVSIGSGSVWTNISFLFRGETVNPSSLRLQIHSSQSGNLWYLTMSPPDPGAWGTLNAPLDFDAGWRMGVQNSRDQFLQDIQAIDWAGVYIRRFGSSDAQNYQIDDFAMVGYTIPTDSDSDGMPDEWEVLYGLNNTNQTSGAAADADGDGMSNYAEYRAGTSPTNDSSLFTIAIVQTNAVPSGAILRWNSVDFRTYAVWRATNVVLDFVEIDDGIPSTPPTNDYEDTNATGAGPYFYKVGVE